MNHKTKLLILCGLPFAGKSTLADKLAEKYSFMRVDLDEIKFELFGRDADDDQFTQAEWDKVYQKMYEQIESLLKAGKSVVHDTGNFTKRERDVSRQIAAKLGVEAITLFVDTAIELAKKRLLENRMTKRRFDVKDKAFNWAVSEMEIPQANEKHLVFQPSDQLESWMSDHLGMMTVVK